MYERLVKNLRTVLDNVYHTMPPVDCVLPCISYYLAYEGTQSKADNREYLKTYTFVVEVWARTVKEMNDLTAEIKRALEDVGFRRDYIMDLTESEVKRKYIRFEIEE